MDAPASPVRVQIPAEIPGAPKKKAPTRSYPPVEMNNHVRRRLFVEK